MERWDVVVVGAGISGLAAAFELTRRGRRVLVVEAAAPGAGQSAGLGRIFRIAHAQPRLCALALEARERWREWEGALGAGRLLGDESLVVAGERAEAFGAALRAVGEPADELDRADIRRRIPLLARDHPWDAGVWDPLGGSLRIRRALAALAARLEVRRAAALAVEGDGTVRTTAGPVRGDAVLVCAGLGTPDLVAPLGLDLGLTVTPHLRITYDADGSAGPACLIAPEAYGLPLGSTGRWALGMRDLEAPPGDDGAAGPDAFAAAVRRQHGGWVPEVFTGLRPVAEVRCVSLFADWLSGGDGFVALRAGPVVALGASNVMKFGPLIGDRLARTALADDGVHPDLSPRARAAA